MLISILVSNPSVDQASLPPVASSDWKTTTPIRLVLNVMLPTVSSTMGKFCLISKCRDYSGASQEDRGKIVKDLETLLASGARLRDYRTWTSSSELIQLFSSYHT